MDNRLPNTSNNKVAWIGFSGVILAAIIAGLFTVYINRPPTSNDNDKKPQSGQPTPDDSDKKFHFAVTVQDHDTKSLVGQATVLLAVGNETVAQEVTDDNGQANFSINGSYQGKSGRFYAKKPGYNPADLEVALTTESRKIILLVPKK